MAVCLDYQAIYCRRRSAVLSWWAQLLAATLLLITLITRVWIKIESTDLGYQLARERQSTVQYDMERRELELQRSVLLRPDRLAKEARERLGMGQLKTEQARKISY